MSAAAQQPTPSAEPPPPLPPKKSAAEAAQDFRELLAEKVVTAAASGCPLPLPLRCVSLDPLQCVATHPSYCKRSFFSPWGCPHSELPASHWYCQNVYRCVLVLVVHWKSDACHFMNCHCRLVSSRSWWPLVVLKHALRCPHSHLNVFATLLCPLRPKSLSLCFQAQGSCSLL